MATVQNASAHYTAVTKALADLMKYADVAHDLAGNAIDRHDDSRPELALLLERVSFGLTGFGMACARQKRNLGQGGLLTRASLGDDVDIDQTLTTSIERLTAFSMAELNGPWNGSVANNFKLAVERRKRLKFGPMAGSLGRMSKIGATLPELVEQAKAELTALDEEV